MLILKYVNMYDPLNFHIKICKYNFLKILVMLTLIYVIPCLCQKNLLKSNLLNFHVELLI